MPPPPSDAARSVIGIIFLILYFSSSPNTVANTNNPTFGLPSPHDRWVASLERQHQRLDVLNQSSWGDFVPNVTTENGDAGEKWGLNLTGFRQSDGYMWEEFEGVRQRSLELPALAGIPPRLDGLLGPFPDVYQNVTGVLLGKWVRSELGLGGDNGWDRGHPRMNLSELAPDTQWAFGMWNRNITDKEGGLMLTLDEEDDETKELVYERHGVLKEPGTEKGLARELSATLTLEDKTHGGSGWEMRLHGIHWPKEGTLVMTTTSDKYAGIFGLPHLTNSEDHYRSSQMLLNKTLGAALQKREQSFWIEQDPYSAEIGLPVPHCEYVLYLQVHPVKMEDIHRKTNPNLVEDLKTAIMGLEEELRFPSGAPTITPPQLSMSMLVYSPDCGFVLESKGPPDYTPSEGLHLQGLKEEVYLHMIQNWALMWSLFIMFQIYILRMQMKEASTPSTTSRVSLYTVVIMAGADFTLFSCIMLLSVAVPSVSVQATFVSFVAFMSVVMGAQFSVAVYKVQEPERRERERIRQAEVAEHMAYLRAQLAAMRERSAAAAAPVAPPSAYPAGTELAHVVQAEAPASDPADDDPPIIIPSDQDIDAEIAQNINTPAPVPQTLPTTNPAAAAPRPRPGALYRGQDTATLFLQSTLALFCFWFLTLNSITWPTILRRIYLNLISLIYLSFWLPQIYRNTIRNCRKAFLWKFVIGQSVLRLVPFGYFYLKDDNVLFTERSLLSFAMLAGWVWCQVWILVIQEVLGARFCIPKGWLPEAWDYHPVLREDDVEGGGLPIGLGSNAPESPGLERVKITDSERKKNDTSTHTRSVDCAICMQRLEVPVIPAGGEDTGAAATSSAVAIGGVQGMLARRLYMVTPCRHVFHSVCLEGWMRFRLQCPICRENLPAL